MKLGTTDIKNMILGTTEVKKIFSGTTLLYEKVLPQPPTNVVRFVSGSSRTITPKYTNSGITLQYSVDNGVTWTTISSGASTTSATEHWFRGRATGTKALFTADNTSNAWVFSGSSDLEVYGNLNFLLCDTLGDEVAPTVSSSYCYSYMFRNCTSLTTAPSLPATSLGNYCYYSMFYDCTSLTTAPSLPATSVGNYSYYSMFRNCTSLTTAPSLPATSVWEDGYSYMFYNCTSFKVSKTKTGSYIYAWRIPTSGSGAGHVEWNKVMLSGTGGTFTSRPAWNTTYYVQNQPV